MTDLGDRSELGPADEDATRSVGVPAGMASRVPYVEQGRLVVYSPDSSEPVEVTGVAGLSHPSRGPSPRVPRVVPGGVAEAEGRRSPAPVAVPVVRRSGDQKMLA